MILRMYLNIFCDLIMLKDFKKLSAVSVLVNHSVKFVFDELYLEFYIHIRKTFLIKINVKIKIQ